MTLISTWRLKDVDPARGYDEDVAFGGGDGWIDVQAPGDTYLALVAAGRLAHPFAGRNEAAAEWVRHREWWWHTRIAVDPVEDAETVELVFEGLDTFAEVFVDGVAVGSSANMFRQMRIDLGGLIGRDALDIAVRFDPVSTIVDRNDAPNWKQFKIFTSEGRTLVRKAQYGWGWDWGPNLPTVGIWKPARIERRTGARIIALDFNTLDLGRDAAIVRTEVELSRPAPVTVELLDPNGAVVATGQLNDSGALTFEIANPRLWWTADLGAQPLYTLIARTPGAPEEVRRVGIRTVAIDESPDPDEPGATFFRFVLNGAPLFARGACWIPASSFIGAVSKATCADYVARAAAANMNMIRVWGGGIYEDDAFYDACDAAGLLVWQDFMFVCAPYPEDDAFIANIRTEAAEQIRRLRSHPCLALWCGNNEIQLLQAFDNYLNRTDDPLVGQSIFETVLPEILAELDPATPYRPSSPWGGANPNSMRAGDVHDWTVWHGAAPVPDAKPIGPLMAQGPDGIHYTRYAEDMARFVSEFGIHGAPAASTLQAWMDPADLALDREGFHERNKDRGNKAQDMASLVTGRAETFDDYVEFTQRVQAEGLKFGIEHFRRRKPHCSGALIWQFNDCWPCVSWSLIDYEGRAKPSYYAVRRAYAPILASFRREGEKVELWITNDTLASISDKAVLRLARFEGGEDWSTEITLEVAANTSAQVWSDDLSAGSDRCLTVTSPSRLFFPDQLLFAPVKNLRLPADPGLICQVEDRCVQITASRHALAVRVDGGGSDVRFDDNDFDLAAGESRTLIASGPLLSCEVRATSWADRRVARVTNRATAEGLS